jgi:nucleoside-diphosphate-sugar epimerase
VTDVIETAHRTGVSAYVGDGANRWSAIHLSDTARLFRLAIERREAGARYHATAESGIPFREIAEAIGLSFGVPTRSIAAYDVGGHFGWLSAFAGKDVSASSGATRARLGW